MGVYSVLLDDSKILGKASNAKSVAIIGCSACANSSIAFDKNLPLSKLHVDKSTGKTVSEPLAIKAEMKRLQTGWQISSALSST